MTVIMTRWSLASRAVCYTLTTLICLMSISFSTVSDADEMLHWKDAWVRSMPPGAQVSAAYGQLMNHGDRTVTLSTFSSEVSGNAEIHGVIADGDKRRMVQLESIDIAPHETLIFEPGGRHIMLLDIAAPPVEGGTVEICATSTFGTRICAQAPVKRQAPAAQDALTNHH